MERCVAAYLQSWLQANDRKPLVIRGARQVGKTWLVRHFAHLSGRQLIEINFEKNPKLATLFADNHPQQILIHLEAHLERSIEVQNSLLFLDEIQSAPELLGKLRWFAEDLPQLPLIAAGSLLEFLLEEHHFSMPVGRINYLYLEPLTFEEFLQAQEKVKLLAFLKDYVMDTPIPDVIHQQLMSLFKEYVIVGGLPAAVKAWVESRSLMKVNQIQHELLATYRDDFAKYAGKIERAYLDDVMVSVPNLLGNKFVYSQVSRDVQASTLKKALQLLCQARVCHRVSATHANGLPLGAEEKKNFFKIIFLDVGLVCASLGLQLTNLMQANDLNFVNQGRLTEQVVGQLLRTINLHYVEPRLYYWVREEKGAAAELDYLIQHHTQIIPIEVKSGTSGQLKSLHMFMSLKEQPLAVRFNADFPSVMMVDVKLYDGRPVHYQLMSLPFYLIGQLRRLLDSSQNECVR